MNQSKTSKPKNTLAKSSERSLLDKVLNEIFERELAAYADSPTPPRKDAAPVEPAANVAVAEVVEVSKVELSRAELTSEIKSAPVTSKTVADNDESEHPAMQEFKETEQDRDFSQDEEAEQSEQQYSYGDYSDWSYETPRPWLSIAEAARMLGRSPRAVERSIIGRWGNRLPEGWTGRKVRIDGQDEWRVVPPPGFRIKHSRKSVSTGAASANSLSENTVSESKSSEAAALDSDTDSDLDCVIPDDVTDSMQTSTTSQSGKSVVSQSRSQSTSEDNEMVYKSRKAEDPFTLEKLFQSATQMAQKELASFGLAVRTKRDKADKNYEDLESTTIVIDRSDEVEKLLRELADTQRELAAERRARLEEMRLMNELQSSMRLLEVNARETRELKDDLVLAQTALKEHKRVYNEFLAMPWWKRLFVKNPS